MGKEVKEADACRACLRLRRGWREEEGGGRPLLAWRVDVLACACDCRIRCAFVLVCLFVCCLPGGYVLTIVAYVCASELVRLFKENCPRPRPSSHPSLPPRPFLSSRSSVCRWASS